MKKKITIFLALIALFVLSIYTVKAINPENPASAIHVEKTGAATYGDYQLIVDESNFEDPLNESGYKAHLTLSADDGYYVKNLTVKFNNEDLELGFEAAAEMGLFFRRTPFYHLGDTYEFFIPDAASSDNKVEVTIEYAEKNPFDIIYKNYEANNYSDENLHNNDNYGGENVLIEGYKDGDLVLPNECVANGCLLEFRFDTQEDYDSYKNSIQRVEGNEPADRWFKAEAVILDDNYNSIQDVDCNDDGLVCSIIVTKRFNEILLGQIHIGYTDIKVFSPNYVGFDLQTDIENFQDLITETGSSAVGFDENNLETSATVFFGTKKLKLIKKLPKAIVIADGGINNSPELDSFDDVTGSGFGYETTYDNATGTATVSINSYYRDKMVLELTLKKNNVNIYGDNKVKITLNRFAFGGNGMNLLEVDELGRNCREANNENTCDNGRYYSVEYRGILSSFYSDDEDLIENFTSYYNINSLTGVAVELANGGPTSVWPRNKDFKPHAVALFYDEDGMIIDTKVFDLNEDVLNDGLITVDKFNELYGNLEKNIDNLTYEYIKMNRDLPMVKMKDIEYFEGHNDSTFFHSVVLISKDEAQEKGIKKIALFLVNDEVTDEDIPKLDFGTGEGVVLEIRDDNDAPQDNGGGE